MTNEDLTRREHQLIGRLREIDNHIASLTNERGRIRDELERLLPQTHAASIARVRKDEATALSVFNYKAQGYQATCATSVQGVRIANEATDPSLKLEDFLILALCTGRQADVDKLVHLEQLTSICARPKSRVHRLWKRGLLEIKWTKALINA